jgi:chromosome segregation protein
MYIKRLEMLGFKSFFNKTILHLEPGVTAVVGPNGCGKSNIFDAIRWVLGEQSMKSLRASDAQDVIFNGTDLKEPLSMAEVSVTFDNANRFLNMPEDEIVVTRRIFRSGESEYLLNKNVVRLKDILDLIMDSGIGAESYSLVAQGKIDLILSARPEERRMVFDEAAGINKYKSQKKEATRKLEETQANLLRVNDIITEVKRQISSLERQANKARRYKGVFEELKTKEINLGILQRQDLENRRKEIMARLDRLLKTQQELSNTLQAEESRFAHRQQDLDSLQAAVMETKGEILTLDNQLQRDKEHIDFNQERVKEIELHKQYLQTQLGQTRERVLKDQEKLKGFQEEYAGIKKDSEAKEALLKQKEDELHAITTSIRKSLEQITLAKKEVVDLFSQAARLKNEIQDALSKQQIHLARKRRLELELAKVGAEKQTVQNQLDSTSRELEDLRKASEETQQEISAVKEELKNGQVSLGQIHLEIQESERQILTLSSHKDFIQKLKTKYEDISESMQARVYLDKLPAEKVTGLLVKINDFQEQELKLSGEAKPFDLDIQKIIQKIENIQIGLGLLNEERLKKEAYIDELNVTIAKLNHSLREQDIALANKVTVHQGVAEQFQKIKEEQELIALELGETDKGLLSLDERLAVSRADHADLEKKQRQRSEQISYEEESISNNNVTKEKVLVAIAQTKTELEALLKRIHSEQATLKILEDTFRQGEDYLANLEDQIRDADSKKESFIALTRDCQAKIVEAEALVTQKHKLLEEKEVRYQEKASGTQDTIKKIDSDRSQLDALKDEAYALQMQIKDMDFNLQALKERILAAYKLDLDTASLGSGYADWASLEGEIQGLKARLDSLGNVNLVAIEEYDELKKRYDFLAQQHSDLSAARESLHEAILKINRSTRKMFLETFELIRQEFRNYFRLLFNGGDAQIFLTDEQDVLDSGIEIICRPPGKKLQHILLLSGGEKSMSAIALIFAIFKVKPSPFCVLDEIDAALDEANVDRYSRLLQEFTKSSQFIIITHNKRTIVNAGVMYGITMEESGVSKIVSVKFAQGRVSQDRKTTVATAAPAA